jgi:hypothetical protein
MSDRSASRNRPDQAPHAASEVIFKNLIEALNRLQNDLDRVELWTAALICFHEPAAEYRPRADFLLPRRDNDIAGPP